STKFFEYFAYYRSGRSGTLVRQGFAVIVTEDADYLLRKSVVRRWPAEAPFWPGPNVMVQPKPKKPVIPIIRHDCLAEVH
nr:hypothetical protein [Tanacetum cinerariifolium]